MNNSQFFATNIFAIFDVLKGLVYVILQIFHDLSLFECDLHVWLRLRLSPTLGISISKDSRYYHFANSTFWIAYHSPLSVYVRIAQRFLFSSIRCG